MSKIGDFFVYSRVSLLRIIRTPQKQFIALITHAPALKAIGHIQRMPVVLFTPILQARIDDAATVINDAMRI
ncbi:hypothetical protein AW736_12090 [Termitidicoccus mucosus]|uniref:Uncharacterized protein n=1 Tax=Termitidicoccus mucosus TaxID=1184151 RepID=A0A178III4_9BACT|nr:hypothetical protein AW736_12090 [Opitutaceae bacterium TSB47]